MDTQPSGLFNRRALLRAGALGFGAYALHGLLGRGPYADDGPGAIGQGIIHPLHRPAKAKRVIMLVMSGGPSQLDLFDYKPTLVQMAGKPIPQSLIKGQQVAQLQNNKQPLLLPPQYRFAKHGKSGQEISELLPNISRIADDICIVRSMHTEAINHDPAQAIMNTGSIISGRPSWGSWSWYGLGSSGQDLPGFVVMVSAKGGQQQPISNRLWHSGFLPSRFQGVQFRGDAEPVHYLKAPAGVGNSRQKDVIDAVTRLNRLQEKVLADPEISTRISQYEMAHRMQTSVPDLADLADEPESIRQLYGVERKDGGFGRNCLLARRMAERGVRFIQLYHLDWDHHDRIKDGLKVTGEACDQGSAALITDLKQRGMLDDTIVIWGGEFGRTPMAQADGRDHHMRGFTWWLAGGGIKPGITYGATDEFGYHAVQDKVHIHDLHATVLHLMGIDHQRLTHLHQGRDFRLTDVHGEVVKGILA